MFPAQGPFDFVTYHVHNNNCKHKAHENIYSQMYVRPGYA